MLNRLTDAPAAPDHRTRVGRERREKTRSRLIQSALQVIAQHGPDLPVIEDYIAAAGVARGTFYNHFKTTGELLTAVAGEMSDEVLGAIDPLVLRHDDAAVRISVRARLYVDTALRYRVWGRFLVRIGARQAVRGKRLELSLTRDIEAGMRAGRFPRASAHAARDILLGAIFFGIETLLGEPDLPRHVEHMLASVLHGMGLDWDEARAVAAIPLPPAPALSAPVFALLE